MSDDTPGEMTYPSTGDEPETVCEPPAFVAFWWRVVGTDIQVRVSVPSENVGPGWQIQDCPTGLLTIHLTDDPIPFPPPDPLLEPIETPGPTFIRQADWDEETQTWR